MITVKFKDLTFKLPNEDKIFKKKIHRFVNEVHDVINLVDLKPKGIFFEIGLCFGVTSITALKTGLFSAAHSMEAHDYNCKLANINAQINDVSINIHNYAASDVSGEGHIAKVSRENIGGHVVTHEPGKGDKVNLITVDDLIEKEGIDPKKISILWCDAQGSEGKILKGAKSVLKQGIPWVMELAPDLLELNGTNCKELLSLLTPYFSRVADLKETDPRQRNIEELKHIYTHCQEVRKPVSEGVTKSSHTNVLLYPR